MADKLPAEIRYRTRVRQIFPSSTPHTTTVRAYNAATDETIEIDCEQLVVATDPQTARTLLLTGTDSTPTGSTRGSGSASASATGSPPVIADVPIPPARSSICLYFGFNGPPPVTDPVLILNGDDANLSPDASTTQQSNKICVNNVCFPSVVSVDYAPAGKSLASVTIVGTEGTMGATDGELEAAARGTLRGWWGGEVDGWELLRVYRIAYAQPAQTPPYAVNRRTLVRALSAADSGASTAAVGTGSGSGSAGAVICCCGDHVGTATLNGAIASGRQAAAEVLRARATAPAASATATTDATAVL